MHRAAVVRPRTTTGRIIRSPPHICTVQVRCYNAEAPSKPTASWERGAKLVKKTDVTNKYLEHIRAEHDPALHLKTIEDEILGTMGKALGKQSEKIMQALRSMEQERQRYDSLLAESSSPEKDPKIQECARRHNEFREKAKTARWELLVHRQAIGFIVNNHKSVHEHFPIGDALPVYEAGSSDAVQEKKEESPTETKQFGDQLDWWQRIGRWK